MGKRVDKKGQISMFIIIGLILIFVFGSLLYLKGTKEKITEIPSGREKKYEGEQEINRFVESCLRPIVLQGLEIMRLQAGYIDGNNKYYRIIIKDKEGKEQVKTENGRKRVVIVDNENIEGNEVPFWVTKEGLEVPSIEEMQEELENYVTRELNGCVGDFEAFKEKGYGIKKGSINVKALFGESVWIDVHFPINVTRGDVSYVIDRFNLEVPINLKKIHDVASRLADYEEMYAYLEEFSLDLIGKYSFRGGKKVQPSLLPPKRFTDVNFDCSYETWDINEVKGYLKAIFQKNLPYLHIAGTSFKKEVRQNAVQQGALESYVYDFLDKEYPSLEIRYIYEPEWRIILDILPKQGKTIRPDKSFTTGIPMMPGLCTFRYRFNYFIDYPVLLKINDTKSAKIDLRSNTIIKEGGYEFLVPLWVRICGNQKRVCRERPITSSMLPIENITFYLNKSYTVTYFCEPSQRLSGDIKIKAIDYNSSMPLEGVDVYYKNNLESCFIGRTDSEGELTAKFPLCEGCRIELYKNGYSKKEKVFSTIDRKDKSIAFFMSPLFALDVEVKAINLPIFIKSWYETDGFSNIRKMINRAYELDYDTSSIEMKANSLGIDINNVNSSDKQKIEQLKNSYEFKRMMQTILGEKSLDKSYGESAIISLQGTEPIIYTYPDPENRKLRISDGNYKISITILGNVDIKEKTYNYEENGEKKTVKMEGFNGTYVLGKRLEYKWRANASRIKGKKKIIFYGFVEYSSSELNPGYWDRVMDITMENGTIMAEICNGVVSGLNRIDCNNQIIIKKDEYSRYIQPKIE